MRYDPDRHHRRSLRLKHYDYSTPGAYFVTICTQDRECLFGDVVGTEMNLNEAGRMIDRWWKELPRKFSALTLDEFVVMPNHLHGLLVLGAPVSGEPREPLGEIADWFKTMTTNEYIRGVKALGWRGFPGRLWQRGYFDHVVRDTEDLERIREYIINNPARWAEDAENPAAAGRQTVAEDPLFP